MGKLTKASFAAAMRRLGIKKVTKKNIGRIAKAARRGIKRRSTRRASPKRRSPRRKTNPKGGNKRMGRGKSPTQTVWRIARLFAAVAPAVEPFTRGIPADWALQVAVQRYTGFDIKNRGGFNFHKLVEGYGPYVGTVAAQKAVSFINKLIRSF